MSEPTAAEPAPELAARTRAIGVVGWCSFLAAAAATMVCFAFLDPLAMRQCEIPQWWSGRLHVYSIGFFFFWLVAAVAAALAFFMAHTDSRRGSA